MVSWISVARGVSTNVAGVRVDGRLTRVGVSDSTSDGSAALDGADDAGTRRERLKRAITA